MQQGYEYPFCVKNAPATTFSAKNRPRKGETENDGLARNSIIAPRSKKVNEKCAPAQTFIKTFDAPAAFLIAFSARLCYNVVYGDFD